LGRIATPQHRRGRRARVDHRWVQKRMAVDLALVDCAEPLLADLERYLEKTAQGHDPGSLALVRTIPGVGKILALVMLEEIEDITRFPRVQAFGSDGRLGKSARESNGTRPGPSGKKIGNAHLQWAFSAAAVLLLTHNAPAQKYLATLATRHSTGKALSILAHQRGRAVYCMLKNQVAFAQAKLLAPEGWRARPSRASHGSHRGKRHPPSHRTERARAWAPSPHQRCMCRTAIPASPGVDWPSVPRLDLCATRTHAWRTVLPRPRARNARDGRRPGPASDVDSDGTRAQHCF
jgi:transposase IS116/IS110/IS902 family protein